jgi:O-antigen/teichoic acid export membrane protein
MVEHSREGIEARAGVRSPFVRTSVLTFGTNVAFATLSLVNVLVVSRVLGPTGRGDVAFLTAIAWFTSNLATFGVQEANVNIAGAEPRLRRSLATNSVLFALVFGLLAIGVILVLIAIVPAIAGPSTEGLRWLTFGSLPMLILAVYLRFLIQADYGFGLTNAAQLVGPVANVVVNGVFAAVGLLTVATAVSTWIGGQIIGTAMLVWYVHARLAGFGRPSLTLARRTISFGVKSHAGRIMLLGNYRLDQWIVGAVSGARELGLYSVAVAWAEALWQLPTALSAVQRPDLVRGSKREAVRLAERVFRVSALVTIVFAAALALAAPILCVWFFGPSFRGSVNELRILAIGALGVVAMKQLGSALTARQRPTLASAAIAVSFVCTVILDVVLIPPYAGIGAAIASSIAYTAGGIAIAFAFYAGLGTRARDLVPVPSDAAWFWRNLVERVRRRPARPVVPGSAAEGGP